ncbi:MAG: hypothetical protein ACOC9D_04990 [Thermodesulfobacteriota bacterium]
MQNEPREDGPPAEDFLIRCPRLGHQVGFSYCRQENVGLPCFKTLDCWHMHFPVQQYLSRELTAREWERAFPRAGPQKLGSLLELIQKAQKRTPESK